MAEAVRQATLIKCIKLCYRGRMETEKKDQRVTIMMSESELEAVDRWAHENHIKSRGEAVRQLLDAAQELLPVLENARNVFMHARESEYPKVIQQVMLAYASIEMKLFGEPEYEEFQDERSFLGQAIAGYATTENDLLLDIMDFAVDRSNGELNDRERFVIERIDEGHDDEAIADAMDVSERTIKSYVKMLMAKTGAGIREELAEYLPVTGPFDEPRMIPLAPPPPTLSREMLVPTRPGKRKIKF